MPFVSRPRHRKAALRHLVERVSRPVAVCERQAKHVKAERGKQRSDTANEKHGGPLGLNSMAGANQPMATFCDVNAACNSAMSTCRGRIPCFTQSAAALPAAWPSVIIVRHKRHDEAAMCEKLAARLAMYRFAAPRGKRHR